MTPSRDALEDVLASVDFLEDRDERADFLIQYADLYVPPPPSLATPPYPDSHKIPYCESEVYVWVVPGEGPRAHIHVAVENPSGVSAKALAGLLQQTISGAPASEIASMPEDLVERLFRQNLSMSKGMGLNAMVQVIRAMAAEL